ncbi:kinase [Sphingomonas psychrotolerans]|uniref:Kinase n=1 Tax=Sphingomonas psychrotolerans TaxID=1327635 RepID=A0A2K8MRP3_9SPHN|nr:kinase [Sphingomonas psychrotolerans]ATY34699.1 kinase [Sphingomonas psychrotolerans]
MTGSLDRVEAAVRGWLDSGTGRPLILGLCGAQGSGKSTLAKGLRDRMEARGIATALLSLDDLYLSGHARAATARDIHPLLRTRGVPLTHDVAHGIALLDAVRGREATSFPRFDKARDEPEAQRQPVPAKLDLLIFEGWCVGARAQDDAAVAAPINALERDADPDGSWRRAVNAALCTGYAELFARIDRLVLLAAPGFEIVARWRLEQEEALRRTLEAQGRSTAGLMDAPAVLRFVAHYERLTCWILDEMPARADLVLRLDVDRNLIA